MDEILKHENEEVKEFFLNEEQYCSFLLPDYLSFQKILNNLGKKPINFNDWKPWQKENINYSFFNNKDGKYGWRKLELIHPVIYVEIVKTITEDSNWKLLRGRFKEFKKRNITCSSIPVLTKDNASSSISNYKNKFEKESLKLALEYKYILNTDIIDCYGSIYTHSIDWAIHTKKYAKEHQHDDEERIGKKLDRFMMNMSNGQTNGIPQGSVLMDFIAEIVLGYIDLELFEKNKKDKITNYKILRHRDDYRIFVNDKDDGRKIIKNLSLVLSEMGMRLSPNKTFESEDVILSSIKKDRLDWLSLDTGRYLIDRVSKHGLDMRFRSIIDELIIIKQFANKYPNSGTIITLLKRFHDRLVKSEKVKDVEVIISILVMIMYYNPRFYYQIVVNINTLLRKSNNKKVKKDLLNKIKKKFKDFPNAEYLDLWIQNLFLDSKNDITFNSFLCEKISKQNKKSIWNIDGLPEEIQKLFKENDILILDKLKIQTKSPIIKWKELKVHHDS